MIMKDDQNVDASDGKEVKSIVYPRDPGAIPSDGVFTRGCSVFLFSFYNNPKCSFGLNRIYYFLLHLGLSGIRIYSGIYSGYSAAESRIAGMEIQNNRID